MMPPRRAFIDIGTNTILCLIAELSGSGYRALEDLAEITRLGEGVDRTRRVSAEAERRSLETLERYLRECRTLGAEEIIAVGTSALRDAENSAEVRARMEQRLGLEVRVISGQQEAAYSFLAVQKGLALPNTELLVIDIGGGSTEFILGDVTGVRETVSIDLGSVRLTERYLHSDPASLPEYAAMAAAADGAIGPLSKRWLGGSAERAMVGIAGTFTTLAAVDQKLAPYSHSAVHGSRLTLEEVRRQVRLYRETPLAERKKIVGLDPKRADVILAGACLIERIMTLFGAAQVTVSDQGVRYGLLYERMKAPECG